MTIASPTSYPLYLLIGSNQGDRVALLRQTTDMIQQRIGSVACASHLYETEPWGDFGEAEVGCFCNQALQVDTLLTPHEALREALAIEYQLGRRRDSGRTTYTSRPIDIDLIFYASEVIDTPELVLPHPRMHLRRFVLEPMCEIAPNLIHPLFHKTLKQLLTECEDTCSCSCCS